MNMVYQLIIANRANESRLISLKSKRILNYSESATTGVL